MLANHASSPTQLLDFRGRDQNEKFQEISQIRNPRLERRNDYSVIQFRNKGIVITGGYLSYTQDSQSWCKSVEILKFTDPSLEAFKNTFFPSLNTGRMQHSSFVSYGLIIVAFGITEDNEKRNTLEYC